MSGRSARSLASRLAAHLRSSQLPASPCLKSVPAFTAAQSARGFATAAEATQNSNGVLTGIQRFGIPALIAGIGGAGAYTYFNSSPSTTHLTTLQAHENPHDIGEFKLTSDKGKPFTQDHVKKEFAVLLFGALDHPEVHMWMDRFAKCVYESDEKCNQEHLKPIFLCLDPEKDTPERCTEMKASLKSHYLWKETFHRRVAIVTGEDVAKVHEAAHTFTRKFFGKHPKNTGTPCSTDLGDIYMISPEGKFLEAYSLSESTPEEISDDWARVQKAWNIHHPTWHGCRNVAKRYA